MVQVWCKLAPNLHTQVSKFRHPGVKVSTPKCQSFDTWVCKFGASLHQTCTKLTHQCVRVWCKFAPNSHQTCTAMCQRVWCKLSTLVTVCCFLNTTCLASCQCFAIVKVTMKGCLEGAHMHIMNDGTFFTLSHIHDPKQRCHAKVASAPAAHSAAPRLRHNFCWPDL